MVKFREEVKPQGAYNAATFMEYQGTWREYLNYLYGINTALVSFELISKYNLGSKLISN